MAKSRRKHEFSPNLGDGTLEERVVLSTVTTSVVRTQESLLQAAALNRLNDSLSGQNLRSGITKQIRAATDGARRVINAQVAQLYANGRPTQLQKADFREMANGVLDATAFRISSLASLLPGGNQQLVPGIQRALLGNQSNSLSSRLDQVIQSNRSTRSIGSFQNAITRAVNTTTNQRIGTFNNFLSSNGAGFNSVDQNGVSIPISQFVGTQLVNQLNNSLGMLSQVFASQAGSTLFPDGATSASFDAQQGFANQYTSALGLVGSQLSSGLSLVPGLASSLVPQLQSALFANGPNSNSLFSALQGLPTTTEGFNTAASSAFSNAFQSIATPLTAAFNVPSSAFNVPSSNFTDPNLAFKLRTSDFTNLFGSQFSTLGNGFNNGFGSGFPGFGTASTNFNTNFGTGFNSVVSGLNTGFGFNTPPFNPTGNNSGGDNFGVSGTGLFK